MKGKRHYIPIVPDKPKPGPKISRLFSWKKYREYKAEKAKVQEKPQSSGWRIFRTIAVSFAAVAIVFGAVLFFTIENSIKDRECDPGDFACQYQKDAQKRDNGNTDPYYGGDTVNNKASGYCSTNSDCSSFGARNGGPAICGSDSLCHICLSLRGETCISGSTGCGGDPNIYIEQGVCVFKQGGRTTD